MTCKRLHSQSLQNWIPKSHITQGILTLMFRALLLICLSSWFSFQWSGWPQSGIPSLFSKWKTTVCLDSDSQAFRTLQSIECKGISLDRNEKLRKILQIMRKCVPWCGFFFFTAINSWNLFLHLEKIILFLQYVHLFASEHSETAYFLSACWPNLNIDLSCKVGAVVML